MPSVAIAELEQDDGLLFDVMEARAFARTKQAIDQAKDAEDAPDGPMAEWVMMAQFELGQRRRAE